MKFFKKLFLLLLAAVMAFNLIACSDLLDVDTDSKEEQEVVITGNIGETVKFDDIEVTINEISFSQYAGGLDGYNKATDGLIYCVINLDVKNTSTSTLELSKSFGSNYVYELFVDEEYKYMETWGNYTDFLSANESIPANATLKGRVLCFKVPEELKSNESSITLKLSYNDSSKHKSAVWKLR